VIKDFQEAAVLSKSIIADEINVELYVRAVNVASMIFFDDYDCSFNPPSRSTPATQRRN
jgi:hypothetical protein